MMPLAVRSLISLCRGTATFWLPHRKMEWFPPSRSSEKFLFAAAAATAILLIRVTRFTAAYASQLDGSSKVH